MAIFKCKMCGGDLNVQQGMTVCECEFCGTTQTIPSADDEKKAVLFNRATQLRRANEFDRAIAVYEQLVNEFPNEAEAYWGLVLCKYGIEYVDDPLTYRKIPTCHRTSYESIFDDVNYKQAIEKADSVARSVYEEEAKLIGDIQKGILRIAKSEEPFDIFICYKETDEIGSRTQDSVLAQELYYQLLNEGFKVFFSRITLEGKLGTQYEPYIFAALNSAKVMVVVGTKPEYFNAVWVKNEWSRFLALMKQDKNKIIIPAYRDMDPYDLPDALSVFQSQDMSKLGFMQDLVRGIKKVIGAEEEKPVVQTVIQQAAPVSSNVKNLLDRGFLSLEDSKWDDANNFFEQVLNENVKEPMAYFGKLMADLRYRTEKDFETGEKEFLTNENYDKIERFGDETLKTKVYEYDLQAIYNQASKTMNTAQTDEQFRTARDVFLRITDYKDAQTQADICETAAKEYIYTSALALIQKAETESKQAYKYSTASNTYLSAVQEFKRIADYKDSEIKITECTDLAELYRKRDIYYKAESACANKDEDGYKRAIELLEKIQGFENSNDKIGFYKQELQKIYDEQARQKAAEEEARMKNEEAEKRTKIIIASSVMVAILVIAVAICLDKIIIPNTKYSHAENLANNGEYEKAIDIYTELGDYKDSQDKLIEAKYENANVLLNKGEYEKSMVIFDELDKYKNSPNKLIEAKYKYANALLDRGEYLKAIELYTDLGSGYEDVKNKLPEAKYLLANKYFETNDIETLKEAAQLYSALQEYNNSEQKLIETYYSIAAIEYNNGNYETAENYYKACGPYSNSADMAASAHRQIDMKNAADAYNKGDHFTAAKLYTNLSGYGNASEMAESSKMHLYQELTSGNLNYTEMFKRLELLAGYNYKDCAARLNNINNKYKQIIGTYVYNSYGSKDTWVISTNNGLINAVSTTHYGKVYPYYNCELKDIAGTLGSIGYRSEDDYTIKFYQGYLIDFLGDKYIKVS